MSETSALMPFDLLITGAALIGVGPDLATLDSGVIGIRGTRIAYVGATRPAGVQARRTLHLPGRIVCPGFINMHYHAGLNFVRGVAPDLGFAPSYTAGLPQASQLTPEEAAALSRLGALEALKSGCTTVVDSFVHAGAIADGMASLGGRLFLSQRLNDVDFASVIQGPRRFDAELGARMLSQAEAFVARWHGAGDGRIQAHLTAHAPDTCSRQFLLDVAALARRHGLRLSTHLAQSQVEVDWVRATHGCSPVRWLDELGLLDDRLLAGHCIHVDEDDIARLGRSGAHVVHIPLGNAVSGRFAPTHALAAAGASIVLATDTMHGDMIEAMRWALAVGRIQEGRVSDRWQPRSVLAMATRDAARALGQGDVLGTLAPGHAADLAIIDARQAHLTPCIDPLGVLVHNGVGADVDMVIVAGRCVIENGRAVLVDEDAVLAEAERAVRAVWSRCPHPLRPYPPVRTAA
ncbi:MAG: amidohydrolase family protein [Rhodocyclaceae bacterium]